MTKNHYFQIPFITIAAILLSALAAPSQLPDVKIHIKLINGLNGSPTKNTSVELEVSPHYRPLIAQTDGNGIATITVPGDATIYTHNTRQYVACADQGGGRVHNDFKVSQIVATGIVPPVAKPNKCGMVSGVPTPGELVLFVRPWGLLEQDPL